MKRKRARSHRGRMRRNVREEWEECGGTYPWRLEYGTWPPSLQGTWRRSLSPAYLWTSRTITSFPSRAVHAKHFDPGEGRQGGRRYCLKLASNRVWTVHSGQAGGGGWMRADLKFGKFTWFPRLRSTHDPYFSAQLGVHFSVGLSWSSIHISLHQRTIYAERRMYGTATKNRTSRVCPVEEKMWVGL